MKAGVGLPGAVLASLYVGLASLPMLVGHLSGIEPLRPAALQGIEALSRRVQVLPVDVERVKRYIAEHATD